MTRVGDIDYEQENEDEDEDEDEDEKIAAARKLRGDSFRDGRD